MNEKKRNKREYLKHYHGDLEGNYHYDGKYMKYVGDEKRRIANTKLILILSAAVCVATVASGFLRGAGNASSPLVILPYIFEVGFAGALVWSGIDFFLAGHPIKEHVYEKTYMKLVTRAAGSALAAGAGLAGNVIYVAMNGFQDRFWLTVLYMTLRALALCLAVYAKRISESMTFERIGAKGHDTV